jgi:hypothetical protein
MKRGERMSGSLVERAPEPKTTNADVGPESKEKRNKQYQTLQTRERKADRSQLCTSGHATAFIRVQFATLHGAVMHATVVYDSLSCTLTRLPAMHCIQPEKFFSGIADCQLFHP